jgi:hypothetical protein
MANTIGVTLLQEGPWKDLFFCNVAPRRPSGAAPAKFRPGRRRGRSGKGRGGSLGRMGALGGRDLGAEAAGEVARRWWPALAVVAGMSGEVAADSGNARPGRLPRGPREA